MGVGTDGRWVARPGNWCRGRLVAVLQNTVMTNSDNVIRCHQIE